MNNAYYNNRGIFDLNVEVTPFIYRKKHFFELSWITKLSTSTAVGLAYILTIVLLFPYIGLTVYAFSLFPVGYIAWLYGRNGAVGVCIGVIMMNYFILIEIIGVNWVSNYIGFLAGNIVIIFLGLFIGHASELNNINQQKLEYNIRVEEKLRVNEERLKTVLHSLPAGIMLINAKNGQIKDINQQTVEMIGRPKESIIGMHFNEFFYRDQEFQVDISHVKEGITSVESYLKDSQGGRVPIVKATKPITIEDQEYVLESFIDISDRRIIEKQLKAEKDITRKFLDTAEIIMLVLNNKGNVIFINKKGCEVLDRSEEELIGKNWTDEFLPADDIEDGRAIFEELKNDGSDLFNYYELGYLTKKGEERTIAWHHSVLMNDEGIVTHIISSGEDITLRKANEKALKASEEKYRSIFDTAANIILSVDKDGTILEYNEKLRSTLGFSRSELYTENISKLIHPDHLSTAMESIREVFSHGISLNKECKMVAKNGDVIDVSVNSSGLKENSDDYTRMICMIEDITEKKQARDNLLEKTEELERFAKLSIGRENKMIELKERIKYLEAQVTGLIQISLGE